MQEVVYVLLYMMVRLEKVLVPQVLAAAIIVKVAQIEFIVAMSIEISSRRLGDTTEVHVTVQSHYVVVCMMVAMRLVVEINGISKPAEILEGVRMVRMVIWRAV